MGVMEGMKPVAAMVVVQFVFAGVNIFYKLAVSDGMDMRVLVAYRFVFASVVLAPIAYFVERKKRTKVTWRVLLLSFVCGLCGGSLAQNLYISGMKLTSATFASAMTNLIPAITFVLAVLFRFERLAIRTIAGQAKVTGTMLGVGGAMLLTFYKGAQVTLWPPTHINLAAQLAARHQHDSHPSSSSVVVHPDSGNRAMGSLLCTGSCFFYALWLILQARLSREYPFHYSTTALMCAMSALQSAAFALCFDRDLLQWHLSSTVRLLAVLYTGVLASGVMLVVLSWCVKRRGPLFASVFNPMMLVVVAVLSSLLLGEELHLGSVLGAVLIVTGLYAVLWGKGREAAEHEPAMAKVGGATGTELPHIDVVVHRLAPPPTSSPQQQQDSTWSPPQQQQDGTPPASSAAAR